MHARLATLGLLLASAPAEVSAHVKWFASFDLLCPPRPPFQVLSSGYFIAFLVFVVPLMFAVACADRWLTQRHCRLDRLAQALSGRMSRHIPMLIRIGVSAFFLSVFLYGGFVLTPELRSDAQWVPWVQLSISLAVLARRTRLIAAAGIVVLYGYAVSRFGGFHLIDDPIFLGVAAYLAIQATEIDNRSQRSMTVLRYATAITLLWAAVEKWAFPEWSFVLLRERPHLTLGFDPELYMVAAGFVEFCAAFLLIAGVLSARVAAVVLLGMFVSAIVAFGVIDAIGHAVIIVVLVALVLSQNPMPARLAPRVTGGAYAAANAAVFVASLALFIGLYYGGHYLSFGR